MQRLIAARAGRIEIQRVSLRRLRFGQLNTQRKIMITFLRIFAYLCIWTTPLQVAIVIWGIVIVATTDYGILSLTGLEFFTHGQALQQVGLGIRERGASIYGHQRAIGLNLRLGADQRACADPDLRHR